MSLPPGSSRETARGPRAGRKPRWWHVLQGGKQEALIAIDLYNRPRADRSLEAFVVHMMMAWLHLLHAEFERRGVDFSYRDPRGRVEMVDGQPKTWDLARSVREHFPYKAIMGKEPQPHLYPLPKNRVC